MEKLSVVNDRPLIAEEKEVLLLLKKLYKKGQHEISYNEWLKHIIHITKL